MLVVSCRLLVEGTEGDRFLKRFLGLEGIGASEIPNPKFEIPRMRRDGGVIRRVLASGEVALGDRR